MTQTNARTLGPSTEKENAVSKMYSSFAEAIEFVHNHMRDRSKAIHTESWQGIDISRRPEAQMREIINFDFRVQMISENLDHYRGQIKPNLPWADEHFSERVCGYPMNPGESWKSWPWGHSAKSFLDKKGRFEVNYMERFWAAKEFEDTPVEGVASELTGIRGRPYGDLASIIKLLAREPLTRQAYLPIFFPEDTGAGGRVPCSLGYHFMMRSGYLNIFYPIRSCDYYRHFRDDIYLAVRLLLWVLDELRSVDPKVWDQVRPGYYSMWIGSLHVFVNDFIKLFEKLD